MKYLLLALLLTSACAKSNGSGEAAATSKSLFSSWTLQSSSTPFKLDLTGAGFGSGTLVVAFTSGDKCQSNYTLSGKESSGSYTLSGSIYTGGGVGDPGCSAINESGTFTKSATVLQFCSTTCVVYL